MQEILERIENDAFVLCDDYIQRNSVLGVLEDQGLDVCKYNDSFYSGINDSEYCCVAKTRDGKIDCYMVEARHIFEDIITFSELMDAINETWTEETSAMDAALDAVLDA